MGKSVGGRLRGPRVDGVELEERAEDSSRQRDMQARSKETDG